MPRGDRTGPNGMGPMTGRGMGYCAGYNAPGFMNCGFGRGMGRGRGAGFGRGFGWRRAALMQAQVEPAPIYPAQPTKEQELQMLENESTAIEQEQKELNKEMTEIKKRIVELKK